MQRAGPLLRSFAGLRKKAIAEFIHDEIYIHYGAPQEIFTDHEKNLWEDALQKYLEKIKILHKGTSLYHPRTNRKVERLNGIVGAIFGNCSSISRQSYGIFISTTTKTSPFYLLYDRHPHLLGDSNLALPSDAEAAPHHERFKLLQSVRKEVAIATYERAFKDKNARDELVQPHKF